jgi:hypothetical protein
MWHKGFKRESQKMMSKSGCLEGAVCMCTAGSGFLHLALI